MDGIKNRKVIFQDFKKVTFKIEGWVGFYLVGEGGCAWKKRPEEHEKAESEERIQKRSRIQKWLTFSTNG